MLRFKNTQFGYSEVFFSIEDLTLSAGKLYSLIGKNGIGKTTFFNTLCQFVALKSGEIFISNEKLFPNVSIAKKIAFVPSKFDGIQHLKVYDYIALGRAPYTNFLGKLNEIDHLKIKEAISILGIDHLALKDTVSLSDGERQLCSIAKALVQETPIILLDEPSAFLDYQNKIKVLQILQKIAKDKNLCIIQSTHDLDMSLEFSDAFLVINPRLKLMKEILRNEISKEVLIEVAFGG
jgi:iron complex transport system ATP-binding protein